MAKIAAPTKEQIETEMKKLEEIRPSIRRMSNFGDGNWAALDAQVMVLRENLSEEDIYERGWVDYTESEAMGARSWIDGDAEETPSEAWKPLIRKSYPLG